MSKVLVLYYSAFGYVAIVAHAIAEGARQQGSLMAQTAGTLAGRSEASTAAPGPNAMLAAAA